MQGERQTATTNVETTQSQPQQQPQAANPPAQGGQPGSAPAGAAAPAPAPTQAPATPRPAASTAGPAPTEEELRRAKEIVARAKEHNVKLPAGGGGMARIMLPNGESRADYIKRRWADGISRTVILREIQSVGAPHDRCTYQVVFSTTKGLPGGPEKTGAADDGRKFSLQPKPQSPQQGQPAPTTQGQTPPASGN